MMNDLTPGYRITLLRETEDIYARRMSSDSSRIVIGSCIYREADDSLPNDRYTVILLCPQENPHYLTGVVVDLGEGQYLLEHGEYHQNIVPAATAYNAYGTWGGS